MAAKRRGHQPSNRHGVSADIRAWKRRQRLKKLKKKISGGKRYQRISGQKWREPVTRSCNDVFYAAAGGRAVGKHARECLKAFAENV